MDNIYKWMRPLLDDTEWEIFVSYVTQNEKGGFVPQNVEEAKQKLKISNRKLYGIVEKLELLAGLYEAEVSTFGD